MKIEIECERLIIDYRVRFRQESASKSTAGFDFQFLIFSFGWSETHTSSEAINRKAALEFKLSLTRSVERSVTVEGIGGIQVSEGKKRYQSNMSICVYADMYGYQENFSFVCSL